MAVVSLKLTSDVEIGKVDQILTVQDTKKKMIGKLKFSKGTVEWWPKGNSVHAHSFTWAQFARALENHNAPVRVVTTKKKPIRVAINNTGTTPSSGNGKTKKAVFKKRASKS
ncbi:hypothetical protein [Ralstonia solanacearum]|uniref:hypothetical protein n=1 Tax=Ralstonia solanacearum TaxID=305 RepID=UPI000A6AA08B|nr:hypothetical protein [Ralstonia solanacearum]